MSSILSGNIKFLRPLKPLLVLGFLVLRYHLEKKKGLEGPSFEGTAWGIKASPAVKYLFELFNLFTMMGPGKLFVSPTEYLKRYKNYKEYPWRNS